MSLFQKSVLSKYLKLQDKEILQKRIKNIVNIFIIPLFKKIKLSLSEEAEWEDYFISEQQKAVALKTQINQTDKEIDQMVYELYNLTEDEIAIVEIQGV